VWMDVHVFPARFSDLNRIRDTLPAGDDRLFPGASLDTYEPG
jgi:hypothetical protein